MKVTIDEKTVREAIEIFKGIEDVRRNLPEDGNEVEEAFYTAIKALEKQIPTKPIEDLNTSVRYVPVFKCPNCNEKFSGFGVAEYCYHCGQHIDWSEWSE